MVNAAILAFIGEICNSYIQQLALVIQKLAHRDIEEKQARKKTDENSSQDDRDFTIDDDFRADEKQELDQDEDQSLNTYCSLRFACGISLMIICMLLHAYYV